MTETSDTQSRQHSYRCDITYGTGSELGLDYLRDRRAEHRVQRGHHAVIIDEVDSVLLDEARTPLIVISPAPTEVSRLAGLAQLVSSWTPGEHYVIDEADRVVEFTDVGVANVHAELGADTIFTDDHVDLVRAAPRKPGVGRRASCRPRLRPHHVCGGPHAGRCCRGTCSAPPGPARLVPS